MIYNLYIFGITHVFLWNAFPNMAECKAAALEINTIIATRHDGKTFRAECLAIKVCEKNV